jgi:primosomal protein N' (replication factor Y)
MTLQAEVILSLPLDQSFSYVVPQAFQEKAKVGSRVLVPFGQRMLTGIIVNLEKESLTQKFKLKEIVEVLDDEPLFSSSFLSFTRRLCDYYYSSWGEVLQSSLPPSFIIKTKARVFLTEKGRASLQDESLSREEREFLGSLQKGTYSPSFLKRKFRARNFPALLSRLEKKDLVSVQRDIKKPRKRAERARPVSQVQLEMDFSLDYGSERVAAAIAQKIGKQDFSPFYLYGPSEKREAVYFFLIREALAKGRRVLFLVPEIALTRTLREKFEKKLGEKAALLHSRLSEKSREVEWKRIKEGEADVVVGPRSALFSLLGELGLIIVDEEQDESFYQQESPCYDARYGAWMRAEQERAVLVYGSTFPSVSGFYRAGKGGYLLSLGGEEATRRKVEIVDSRHERGLISAEVEEKIAQRVTKGEQVLVFINRRGYASFLLCSSCSYVPRCVRCDIALSYHKRGERLVCRYCNYSLPRMESCPECGSRMIKERGVGVEAVEEELRKKFPLSPAASFETGLSKKEQETILRSFSRRKVAILVGTEFLAHQLDLPPVNLVAVLFPETILTLADYRASQRTFQTLTQMMRFLDGGEKAEVVIQTAMPHHFSIRLAAAGNYLSFFNQELRFRRLMNYPPFSHMVEILFLGENLRNAARSSREFSEAVKSGARKIEILGPALASISKMRGLYRVQIILRARRKEEIDSILRKSLRKVKSRRSVFVYD